MRYAILGGGIAGLATGYYLKSAGVDFTIFEKSSTTGGLAESYAWHGFNCDFAAHRFFTTNEEVKRAVLSKVPMLRHNRRSKLFIRGHWLNDPINPMELFRIIPFKERVMLVHDLIRTGKESNVDNFQDYIVNKYGQYMFNAFFKPYTEKLFRIPSNKISVLWARKKSRLINPFKKADTGTKKYFGHFYYPIEGGYGAIPEAYLRPITDHVEVNAEVVHVIREGCGVKGIEYCQDGSLKCYECDGIISTLPLPVTGKLFDVDVPLTYGEVEAVYLLLNKAKASEFHWVYFVDEDICVNRMVEFKQMSPHKTPEETTVLCAEVTKKLANPSAQVIKDLEKTGFLKAEDVLDTWTVSKPHAYPTYYVGYEKIVEEAITAIEANQHVHIIGRAAEFVHREVDDVIETAKCLAEKITGHQIPELELDNENSNPDKVCIVVLSFNNILDTTECLDSVRKMAGGPYHTIVVDNGSTDNSVERLRAEFQEIELVEIGRNLGVSSGFNQGIFRALELGYKYVFVLNNDTVVDEAMMRELLSVAEQDIDCAMVMPSVMYYPPRNSPYTRRDVWSDGGYYRYFPPSIKLKDDRKHVDFNQPRKVEYAPSCGLLIKRQAFSRAGLLDQNYFLFYEDWDFSTRLRNLGMNIWVAPKALLWHKVSSTTKKDMSKYWESFAESGVKFFRRHHSPLSSTIQIGFFLLRDIIFKVKNLKYIKHFIRGLYKGAKASLSDYPDLASYGKHNE